MSMQETGKWESLGQISGEWIALLGIREDTAGRVSHEVEPAPFLNLQQFISDPSYELRACGLSTEQIKECSAILDANLRGLAEQFQSAFQAAWIKVHGNARTREMARDTLDKLHCERFKEEVLLRRNRLVEILKEQKLASEELLDSETVGEWTDETRALMERVYQQHPKLEAHEKKLLSEVSGLSLRQISIWVSLLNFRLAQHARALSLHLISWPLFGFCSLAIVRARC